MPLWKRRGQVLKGMGFNLDFADDYSEAKDLRTGDIINYYDLLVTSGLDGLFPEGLFVGVVTHIDLLEEGDYCYTLEAKPSVGNLDELVYVEVLPPLGFDPSDLPPTWGRR
jgi:cell shape-determining protein MreC